MPEARYALAQAAIYLSLAPKSNAAGRALAAAQRHVREHGAQPVPAWLVSGPRPGDRARRRRGRARDAEGYDNPHAHPGHVSPPGAHAGSASRASASTRPTTPRPSSRARLEEIRRLRGRR